MKEFINKYPSLEECEVEVFNNFILKNNLTKIQGEYYNSNYYIDENRVRLAYTETSSDYWGITIYKIVDINNNL
jgi:hypothetical protein